MCIKETQRLQTTVPFIGRENTKEFEVDGLRVPPGTIVNICLYEMCHNPHVWDNPEDFQPERFQTQSEDSYKFVPFSAGPRFRFEVDLDHKIERTVDLVFRSETGIRLKIEAF